MTETPTDPPIEEPVVTSAYRVAWELIGNGGIYKYVMEENEDGELEETGEELPYPSSGWLQEVDITPDFSDLDNEAIDPYNLPLFPFTITGHIEYVIETETPSEDPEEENEITYEGSPIPYICTSLTLTSVPDEGPKTNCRDSWVWPDQFPGAGLPEDVPIDYKEYGGVYLYSHKPVPDSKDRGEKCVCGHNPTVLSPGYQYLDVFCDFDFAYIRRNSIKYDTQEEYVANELNDSRSRFPLKPKFPDVVDEEELEAPVLPMDAVTAYVGDEREEVTIVYKAKFSATDMDGNPIKLENGTLTLTQVVTQDIDQYKDQAKALQFYCNFSYVETYERDKEDMAPGYPDTYPYTVVSGYDGQPTGEAPTERNTVNGRPEGPLQHGDVWYSPLGESLESRKYYQVNSFVDEVTIIKPGTIYQPAEKPIDLTEVLKKNKFFMKSLDNILGNVDMWIQGDKTGALQGLKDDETSFEVASEKATEEAPLKERKGLSTYPVKEKRKIRKKTGKEIVTYELDNESLGRGLMIDAMVNKDGGIVRADIVFGGKGYRDGDLVAVMGGDCILQVKVNSEEFWTDTYVDRFFDEKPAKFGRIPGVNDG